MGNGNVTGEKKVSNPTNTTSTSARPINKSGKSDLNQRKSNEHLIFYACTDKARV